MKVLLLANNYIGREVTTFLKNERVDIVGLVIHPKDKQKYTEEIIQESKLEDARIFDGSKLHEEGVISAIKALEPNICISALFGYILKKEFMDLFSKGCVNIHPGYLPFNKGAYPNVFSIIDGTPAGATVHYIDEKVDTGNIIDRIEVKVTSTDTGETLYKKLEEACVTLFKDVWPTLLDGSAKSIAQSKLKEGTWHRYKDVDAFDEIDPQKKYSAKHIIDVLRARTFPPYKGAYFIDENGKKVYMRIELLTESDLLDSTEQ